MDNPYNKYADQVLEISHVECNSDDVETLNQNLLAAILEVAEKLGLISKPVWRSPGKNPWLHRDCEAFRDNIRNSLKKCKESSFSDKDFSDHKQLKKSYLKLLESKKEKFKANLLYRLANCSNSNFFGVP